MTEERHTLLTQKRNTVAEVAGATRAVVSFSVDGATVRGTIESGADATDAGVEVTTDSGSRSVPWSAVIAVESTPTDRHVMFVDHVSPTSPLGTLRASSPAVGEVVDVALRSWLGATSDLDEVVRKLSTADIDALRAEALRVLRTSDSGARGLLLALGLVGDARDALALGDAVCDIAETEEAAWRWRYGLEALRILGTRDAHMQVQRIAMQSANPPTIAAARSKLVHIATDMGVPVWEIQDELVPSCGLATDGKLELSFDDRRFDLQLDDDLHPMLRERASRTRHRDLPAPRPTADPERARHARQTWDVVREQILEAVPVQVNRFEEALAQQTRWSGPQWNRVVRRHPLLHHLLPRAVWGTYSKSGRKLRDTFRIAADDYTLWGPDDEPYELDPDCPIGLPHRLDLADELRAAWGTVLADYEVVTMFPQIDRPTYRPLDDQKRSDELMLDIAVPGRVAFVMLHRRGWQEPDGYQTMLQKVFRNSDVRAMVKCRLEAQQVVFTELTFRRHLGFPDTDFQLRDVPKVVYTEALYDLEQLRMPQETGGWAAVIGR